MSFSPANSKSLHRFSSLTRRPQVHAMMTSLDSRSEKRTASPSPDSSALIANRTVASRSSRHPRLSFSSFAPSSENNHRKKLNSDPIKEVPPQKEEEAEEEEEANRSLNLRPRKVSKKKQNVVIPAESSGDVKNQKLAGGYEPRSSRQRGIPAESPGLGGVVAKENPRRLWVALSREEIEEDMYSMNGSKPSRKPRKRSKATQKCLDVMFPGLGLVGMKADSFRVSDSSLKVRNFVYLLD
ncbi:unnamed protein product [Cochlearia groenlandica]